MSNLEVVDNKRLLEIINEQYYTSTVTNISGTLDGGFAMENYLLKDGPHTWSPAIYSSLNGNCYDEVFFIYINDNGSVLAWISEEIKPMNFERNTEILIVSKNKNKLLKFKMAI